ncbi:SMP-LTD domain-containing protein [Favolaschia claudopus]|uniref:SMP-LTD domain-containing protein n=1 Tax=Favolaschia claudopus TaxID=2862362 RepID=A0AAW0EG84_9AGAR
MGLKALFYAYILGGLTLLPLVIAALIYFTIYTSVPVGDPDVRKKLRAELAAENDCPDADTALLAASDINDTPKTRKGWLTVRRTFEESSLEGGYVGMVRSFLDARSKDPKRSRPKDTWFVALKGKVLYLYEDEAMTECEAAIELGSHEVTVYPEGQLDGELFAKRNAICLKPKSPPEDKSMPSVTKEMTLEDADVDAKIAESGLSAKKAEKERDFLMEEARLKDLAREEALDVATPWFIFVRSNVEMEDWYLALIHASDNAPQTPYLNPLQAIFQPSDMNHLVNTLDEQPDVIPMRWLNALIGRIFFSFYRTHFLEDYIISRFMKKLSKVKRPTFLTDIVVTEVAVGNKPPTLSKPMLKELTKEGDASLEVHLLYKGEFRITIEATATINLGSRFKPYSVKLVLAAVLKEIEGNMLIKVKRPPSNRIWYAFTQTPRMVFEVEPIVSDRQITWSMITSTLESSLKAIIQESVVLPNMDDIAFFESTAYGHRGGIWSDASRREKVSTFVTESVPDDDGSIASVPLPPQPSSTESEAPRSQSAAELSRDGSTSSSPPDNGDTSWTSSYSSGDDSSRTNRRKSWFSSVRSDGARPMEEQNGYVEDDENSQRGRTVDVDKTQNPRSRSTPNATDPDLPPSSDGSDDSHLQPPPRTSTFWGHSKSNSVEEYSKPSSEPSTSVPSGSSPMATTFLSTLKSRDKQAISNTAKEAMRKWSANWSGLMKDKNAAEGGASTSAGNGDEMPDHGSFVSRFRGNDSSQNTPQKARASYAEVRAAVAERRRAGDRSPGPPTSSTVPIPIPEVRERAVTMQPGRPPSQNGGNPSPSFMARAATAAVESNNSKRSSGSPSVSRTNTVTSELDLPSQPATPPPPIQAQPQAKMMTIPGIHASHRGEVMSMGYVAPQPTPPSPDARAKNPAIQSVYRLWKTPATTSAAAAAAEPPLSSTPDAGAAAAASPEPAVASFSSSPPSSSSQTPTPADQEGGSSSSRPSSVSGSPPTRPMPPPLPPRSARTPSLTNVFRPDVDPPRSVSEAPQPSASAALQSIAAKDKDKRASVELGLGSPPSRRSTLPGSRTPSGSISISSSSVGKEGEEVRDGPAPAPSIDDSSSSSPVPPPLPPRRS